MTPLDHGIGDTCVWAGHHDTSDVAVDIRIHVRAPGWLFAFLLVRGGMGTARY
jgi:hypothetical protein